MKRGVGEVRDIRDQPEGSHLSMLAHVCPGNNDVHTRKAKPERHALQKAHFDAGQLCLVVSPVRIPPEVPHPGEARITVLARAPPTDRGRSVPH